MFLLLAMKTHLFFECWVSVTFTSYTVAKLVVEKVL